MKIFLTIILGIMLTLCFAPYYYFGLGFISFSGMLLLLDEVGGGKKHFWYGWLFGFAHHVTGLYWISYSMLVEPDKFAWMIPFSVTILPAYLATFIGFVFWVTYRLRLRRVTKVMFLAGAWVVAEMLRSWLFTGFAWNLLGYVFMSKLAIAQAASYISVYGLSLIAVMIFSAPYVAIRYVKKNQSMKPLYRYSICLYYLFPAMLLLIFLSNWGTDRIRQNSNRFEKTKIRIVQPNIPQKEKFDPLRVGDQLFKYYTLTLQAGKTADYVPDLIVWPEAATPLNLDDDKPFLAEVADVIPYSSYLILGSIRHEGWILNHKVFNSVQVIDSEGNLERTYYDKAHLVPFGEYVPLRSYLPFVEKIANGIGDFDKGTGPKTLKLHNSSAFTPLICYEIIFPGQIKSNYETQKPEWILNITNDAWFGNSSGPYQHLDAVRMRAIEEGMPVIRSANTGISAVVDDVGRILDFVKLNHGGVIDTKLPSKTINETFYSRYGNQVPLILAGGLIILSVTLRYLSKALSKAR
jgi:apolipoprotein N-acyltransferase